MNSIVTQRQIAQSESFYGKQLFSYYTDAAVVYSGNTPTPTPPIPPYVDGEAWIPKFEPITVNFKLTDATHKKIYFNILSGKSQISSFGDVTFRGNLVFYLKDLNVCEIPIYYRNRQASSTTLEAVTVPTYSPFYSYPLDCPPTENLMGMEAGEGGTPRTYFQAPVLRICNADRAVLTPTTILFEGCDFYYGYFAILNEFNY